MTDAPDTPTNPVVPLRDPPGSYRACACGARGTAVLD